MPPSPAVRSNAHRATSREVQACFHHALPPARFGPLWGCEAEAAVLALCDDLAAALTGPVAPAAAARIGALCDQVGLRAAEPQSHSVPSPLDAPTPC